jgi:hypothetical protein
LKIEVVLDDGVGLFWMWVVREMPCGVGQRSRSGGRVSAEFLESAGGRSSAASSLDPQK